MEYISSDTNVWIDFLKIDRLELPFRLDYIYLMNDDTIEDELLAPAWLGKKLVSLGLHSTELTEEEFYLAEKFIQKYAKPSRYDCIALAIAKVRGIVLLTGDGALRRAASAEGVRVLGTIGILDQLHKEDRISKNEYLHCLKTLLKFNGREVRLPQKELEKRINRALRDV